MESDQESAPDTKSSNNIGKTLFITVAALVIIVAAVYAAYRYSQKQASDLVLPAGITYLGPSPTSFVQAPTAVPYKFTADSSVAWKTQEGVIYPFSFSFPETLTLVVFTGDKTDSVAIACCDIAPQLNILLNMELINDRDPKLSKQPKIEYVRSWWKFFSGLKDVSSVETFTNAQGLKGYKARYLNTANSAPNLDVFFEIPGQPDKMIHMANGVIDPAIFDRIVDSVKWK